MPEFSFWGNYSLKWPFISLISYTLKIAGVFSTQIWVKYGQTQMLG